MRAIVVRIESHLYPPPGVENAGAGIIGLGFGLGACDVLFANAAQTILPDLVPKADLQRANSRQFTMTALGQMFL